MLQSLSILTTRLLTPEVAPNILKANPVFTFITGKHQYERFSECGHDIYSVF